ncbi:MAG TPA: Uma2 family endonuclease [Planctomycetota bacterium]|nr:Uma2 family endonuclease [Planctomycetota bacterium]
MSTLAAKPIATVEDRRFVLHGVSWDTYERLVDDLAEEHVRLTYDNGDLELTSPSPMHEFYKARVRSLIHALAEELEIDYEPFGSMTCKRKGALKGLEPDECFYVQNAEQIMSSDLNTHFDFSKVPPPDLAVEIDINSSSVDRDGIYAALKVPEVWRYDGQTIRIYVLKSGAYHEGKKSLSFPVLSAGQLNAWMCKAGDMPHSRWIKSVKKWLRSEVQGNK